MKVSINDIKSLFFDIRFIVLTIFSIITFIFNYFLIRKTTDVGIISTYNGTDKPSSKHIKNSINSLFFRKIDKSYNLIEDLSVKGYTQENIDNFILEHTSQIKKLINADNLLSLFLFAHMPISLYLGYKIGKAKSVELYHKLRTEKKNKWKWDFTPFKKKYKNNWEYKITSNLNADYKEVILDIDISFPIYGKKIIEDTNKSYYRIELLGKDNSLIRTSFLRYKYQLTEFSEIVENAFYQIENVLGSDCKIHLFLTAPNPFSFIIGQQIHINGPKVLVYDKNNEGNYVIMKTIN